MQKIVQTFDAGFDTPADPLTGSATIRDTQRVAEQEQQVRHEAQQQIGPNRAGHESKHVKILNGHGKNAKLDRIIPMDIHPEAIDVPKRSISSAYAGQG